MIGRNSLKECFVLLIIFILIVLLSSLIEAEDLHGDWYFSGDTFTVEGDVYLVTHYNFYDTMVVLRVNDNAYIIEEGRCRSAPTKKYCIDEIYRDLANASESDPIKFEEGEIYAGIYVKISTKGPDISISRSFSTTNPELNEEVTVTVTLENEGDEGTDSFLYKDMFPKGVIITASSSGTERTSRTITYDSNIPPDSEKTFTYRFKVTDYLEFTSQAEATYYYAGSEQSITVSSKTIKVVKPYEFTTTLSPKSIEVGEQSALSIKIENLVSKEIEVNELRIIIPSFLSLQAKPGELEKRNEKYYWNGTLDSGEYKMINLLLEPVKSRTYGVSIGIRVTDSENKEFSEVKTVSLTSTLKELEPILSVLDTSVSEGSSFRVAFSVKNPNEKVGFRNIKASVKSEIFPELKAELEDLMPGKTQTLIVNDTLTAPFLDEKTEYEIEALGSYETTTNEQFEFSKKATLTVTPVSEVITILQSIDKTDIDVEENVTVTVEIKNNNEEAVQVSVHDDYSEGASIIGGKTSDTIYFDGIGTKQAYTYKLQIPLTYNKEELVITTSASIQEKNYVDNKTTIINVNLTEPVEKEELQEEPEEELKPEQKKEKEPGFFKKIINAIADFFNSLFSKED